MAAITPMEKIEKIEGVLRILEPDEVSDDRIEAFNKAISLYWDWLETKREL